MILDTNALSAFLDGDRAVQARLTGVARVALPVIVLGEFRYGISGSRHRSRYEQWFSEHLSDFDVLDITAATTVSYAQLRRALKDAGTPIPANDAWIAALAVEHGLRILSRDTHFDVVPGVKRVPW